MQTLTLMQSRNSLSSLRKTAEYHLEHQKKYKANKKLILATPSKNMAKPLKQML
jgi:uncharacterized protein YciI